MELKAAAAGNGALQSSKRRLRCRILIVVILAAIQFGFVYQAKATLNHAALQAARAGAVSNGAARCHSTWARARAGATSALRMLRYKASRKLSHASRASCSLMRAFASSIPRVRRSTISPSKSMGFASCRTIDCTFASTSAWRSRRTQHSRRESAARRGHIWIRAKGSAGRRVSVRGCRCSAREGDPFHQQLLRRNRLPITATATVRMQSPLRFSELLVSRAELPGVARVAADAGAPTDADSHNDDEDATGDTQSSAGSGEQAVILARASSVSVRVRLRRLALLATAVPDDGADGSSSRIRLFRNPPLCTVSCC